MQFAHWANKEQIAKRKEQLKHLSYRRRPVSIVFCGLCHLCYETIDPDLRRGDDFIFFFDKLLFIAVFMSHISCPMSQKNPPSGPRANECLRGWTLGDFLLSHASRAESADIIKQFFDCVQFNRRRDFCFAFGNLDIRQICIV